VAAIINMTPNAPVDAAKVHCLDLTAWFFFPSAHFPRVNAAFLTFIVLCDKLGIAKKIIKERRGHD